MVCKVTYDSMTFMYPVMYWEWLNEICPNVVIWYAMHGTYPKTPGFFGLLKLCCWEQTVHVGESWSFVDIVVGAEFATYYIHHCGRFSPFLWTSCLERSKGVPAPVTCLFQKLEGWRFIQLHKKCHIAPLSAIPRSWCLWWFVSLPSSSCRFPQTTWS